MQFCWKSNFNNLLKANEEVAIHQQRVKHICQKGGRAKTMEGELTQFETFSEQAIE